MSYVREDMTLIELEGCDLTWCSSYGGGRTDTGYEPLELHAARSDASVGKIAGLYGKVGRAATVAIRHLGPDGRPTGHGLEYTGRLTSVEPAPFDANSFGMAYDKVTVQPYKVQEESHENQYAELPRHPGVSGQG